MNIVSKIVFTGGPCAGKTEGIKVVKEYLENKGFLVIVIAETSTQIIESGFKWWDNSVPVNVYQNLIFKYQLERETIIFETIENSNMKNVIVLLDRGLMDGKAYMNDIDFIKMLKNYSYEEKDILQRYNMVIHLQSVASVEENLFNNETNKSRKSSVEQAKLFDQNVKQAWIEHKNLFEIPFCKNFEEKTEKIRKYIKGNLK